MCLRAEFSPKSKPVVVAAFPDKHDMRQFWELKLRDSKKGKYSIINVSFQFAMEVTKHGAVLLREPRAEVAQEFFMAQPQRCDDSGYIIRSTY